nr:AbiV family abortive infection protein [Brevibacterium renqingii]
MEMHPSTARTFWRSLMDNASGLIADAHVLLERGSFGRARSLTVLAQEELGKALWIYEVFEQSWNTGIDEVREVSRLTSDGRRHTVKYMEAFVFSKELASFWGDYDSLDLPEDESPDGWRAFFAKKHGDVELAGKQANEDKMAGFYVDMDSSGDSVRSPADVSPGTIADDLQTAAQVVEMLLIKDHSRMKLEATTPYDSTHVQQNRLLPISHPEDWVAASQEFRDGSGTDATR